MRLRVGQLIFKVVGVIEEGSLELGQRVRFMWNLVRVWPRHRDTAADAVVKLLVKLFCLLVLEEVRVEYFVHEDVAPRDFLVEVCTFAPVLVSLFLLPLPFQIFGRGYRAVSPTDRQHLHIVLPRVLTLSFFHRSELDLMCVLQPDVVHRIDAELSLRGLTLLVRAPECIV